MRKYYESIDKECLIKWLQYHIKNDNLIWLIEQILNTFDNGLSIGSYLSQHLGNLYLSDIYHQIESIHKIRRGQKQKVVSFQCFYMDDILICGSNSRELIKVANYIVEELQKKKLSVKENWQCVNIDSLFIDMVGFRIYRDHKTIRRKILKRIRRSIIRYNDTEAKARRMLSYYGNLKHSNSLKFCQKYDVYSKVKNAKKKVSNGDKEKNENKK